MSSERTITMASSTSMKISGLAIALAGLATTAGCAGIINNDPDFRWYIFSHFGSEKICPEMTKSGIPIKLADGAPGTGRFFPTQCSSTVDDRNRTVTVRVGGTGYGFVSPAKRIGFRLSAA